MPRKSLQNDIQLYPTSPALFWLVWIFICLAVFLFWGGWHSFGCGCDPKCSIPYFIFSLFFLILSALMNIFRKNTIEISPAGIAQIKGNGKRIFISWEELDKGLDKTRLRVSDMVLSSPDGDRKIPIGNVKNFTEILERVINKLKKRFKAPPLPLTLKGSFFHTITVDRRGLQLKTPLASSFTPWCEIKRIDIGKRYGFRLMKWIGENGRVNRFYGKSKQVLSLYLLSKKIMGKRWPAQTLVPIYIENFWLGFAMSFLFGPFFITFGLAVARIMAMREENALQFWLWSLALLLGFIFFIIAEFTE